LIKKWLRMDESSSVIENLISRKVNELMHNEEEGEENAGSYLKGVK
jgi:hypothetical protein